MYQECRKAEIACRIGASSGAVIEVGTGCVPEIRFY